MKKRKRIFVFFRIRKPKNMMYQHYLSEIPSFITSKGIENSSARSLKIKYLRYFMSEYPAWIKNTNPINLVKATIFLDVFLFDFLFLMPKMFIKSKPNFINSINDQPFFFPFYSILLTKHSNYFSSPQIY